MADTQEDDLPTFTPVLADYVRAVDDPAGTPVSGNITPQQLWNLLNSLTADTPVDADSIAFYDAGGSATDKVTLANLADNWLKSRTETLTNKRITPRVTSETSSATPTINTDNADRHKITALAAAITSFTTNLSGTPTDGQELDIEILDDGTARAITWGASFASGPATLPTTTILSKWLYVKLRYSSSRSKWICMATGSEA